MASHSHSPSRLLGDDDNHSMHDHVSKSSSDEHMTDYDANKIHDSHVDQEALCHLLTRTTDLKRSKWRG